VEPPLPPAGPARGARPRFAYVGRYTRGAPDDGGITVFAVEPDSGALAPVQTVASDNPSFLALHPSGRFLYAVNETDDFGGRETGSVEAYAVDPAAGDLTLLNRQDSGGAAPAHLAVAPSGAHLAVANYGGATFTLLPIAADGRLDPVSGTIRQAGSGPDRGRQEAPHPHAVAFDPAGRFLAAADLGTDQVRVFRIDPAGGLLPVSEATPAPGAGPRHLAFHPTLPLLYVINELDATITLFPYDGATGQLGAAVQSVSTLPAGFAGPRSTAEIAVHPSGRFLYGSNRGVEGATDPVADSIAAFAVDPASGGLTPLGHATDGIDMPRHFALDPTGARLYACNQDTDSIVQFAVDGATGALTPTGQATATPTPVCLLFAGVAAD